jgi:K(+)-stimulated pyrophosphate-energized sodium pump
MNILIKLTCLVSLVIAPIIGSHDVEAAVAQEIQVEVVASETDVMEATITTTTSEDGTVKTEVKKIKGTEAEVEATIAAIEDVKLHVEH